MNRREFATSLLAGASVIAAPRVARSQTVYNLKLGHFISPKHIFAEPNGFNIPRGAAYGTYEIQIRLWDGKGKPLAHNEEEFQVVPKDS